ncbi:hypothetical protein AMATHDRAFT_151549 [Amanita thiersii Skay4041]|uniref:FAS1 domain-containing protein n=1 Tax=Amanita thiersii Skay4041 TaxID=703135 RepID=A0A2A9NED9_9AGAR|nr:hypothetical protein AMATHDRAFT_151549 [Amanita thiersii Skay4041]
MFHDRFSRVLKAVDYIDEVAALLNDTTVGLTFFAPHNKALRAPNKESSRALFFVDETAPVDTYDFETTLSELEDLDCQFESPLGDDREERKRFLKKILRAILEYHILPRRLDVVALSDKTTHPTNLSFKGAMGGRPVRIRTEQKSIPPILVLNLYSHVVRPDMEASNGLIHVIDHPLFPPLSAFQELFMAPKYFSIFTSVIQRTGLADELDFSYKFGDDNGEGYPEGSPAVTVFAPTNRAFDALPRDLQFFLFSPFGRRALKKLVQYHIVPDFVLHAGQYFNFKPRLPCPEPISLLDITLPTLYEHHPLHAHIGKFKVALPIPGDKHPYHIKTKFSVDGYEIDLADLVALNGAIHVIDKLLDPRGPRHGYGVGHEDEVTEPWNSWQTWLPAWAET